MADFKEAGKFPLGMARDGDVVQDSQITRAGSVVLARETLIPLTYGAEVFRDSVIRPDGEPETRIWTNYPNGAVMALPFHKEETQVPQEATIVLAKDLRLYGTGETSGIEAMDRAKKERASSTAMDMAADAGLEIRRLALIGRVNETSGRQQNWTDIVAVQLSEAPSERLLEAKRLQAKSLETTLKMVFEGKIQNAATIAALFFLGEFLKEPSNS